jgi:hypothetical protein
MDRNVEDTQQLPKRQKKMVKPGTRLFPLLEASAVAPRGVVTRSGKLS